MFIIAVMQQIEQKVVVVIVIVNDIIVDSAPAFPKVGSGLSSWGPGNNKLPKETQILSWLSSFQNLSQNSCCAKKSGFLN